MGPTFVFIFLGLFSLAIGQAVVRRMRNPFGEIAYQSLSSELQAEVARILPGFLPGSARITRNGDEVRCEGHYLGESVRLEADFDPSGALIELDIEGSRSAAVRSLIRADELPVSAQSEIARVLGDAAHDFEPSLSKAGQSNGEAHFEVQGRAGEWKWEITVTESGRLLELEKEKRRRVR